MTLLHRSLLLLCLLPLTGACTSSPDNAWGTINTCGALGWGCGGGMTALPEDDEDEDKDTTPVISAPGRGRSGSAGVGIDGSVPGGAAGNE
jgi:hypothetical protein